MAELLRRVVINWSGPFLTWVGDWGTYKLMDFRVMFVDGGYTIQRAFLALVARVDVAIL